MIGKRDRVYAILNHKRPLTLKMIRKLREDPGIPASHLSSHRKPTQRKNRATAKKIFHDFSASDARLTELLQENYSSQYMKTFHLHQGGFQYFRPFSQWSFKRGITPTRLLQVVFLKCHRSLG